MEIFRLFGSVFVNTEEAEKSISKTEKKAESFGAKLSGGIKTAGKWALGVVGAATAVGAAMMGAATKVAGAADEIDKASRRAGTNAEDWQKLKYAMGQSGIDASTLEKTMVKNQKALNEAASGTGKAAEAYDSLGISIKNADGTLRASDSVYQDVLKSLADMADVNERNRLANDLFGKSYSELAPILDGGSAGIEELTSRAEQLGLVMSQETVDAGVLFGDTMDDLKQVGGAVFNMFAAELLPVLQGFVQMVIDFAPKAQEVVGQVVDYISQGVEWFKAFWAENGEDITKMVQYAFENLSKIVEAALQVIRGIIDVVMGLIHGDWDAVWNGIKGVVDGVFTIIKTTVEVGLTVLGNIIKSAGKLMLDAGKKLFESLWDGMKGVWKKMTGWIKDVGKDIVDAITFWDNNDKSKNGKTKPKPKPNGSHASGLAYVPFDGYVAELHRGERVVTAEDNKSYNSQQGNSTYNFTFNSPRSLSPSEAAAESKKVYRQMQLGF